MAKSKEALISKVEKTRIRRRSYTMDLRIHSPSSLGYMHIKGIDTAPALVRLAKVKGLDIISVTDYFSGAFVDSLKEAAINSKIKVLPGMVLRASIEHCKDVVLTCFFPEEYTSSDISKVLRKLNVPDGAAGNSEYIVKHDLHSIIKLVEKNNGIIIPSRMDKTPHRKGAIKMLVEQYGFRAFDLAYHKQSSEFFAKNWPELEFQLFSFSNAYALAQVGSRNSTVKLAKQGFAGLQPLVEREARI